MTNSKAEQEIRALIEARSTAIQAGDIDAMVADLAEDVVSYDVTDPLRSEGKGPSRKRATEWLAAYDGKVSWENRDVQITADGTVAFSHGLSHVMGNLKTGAKIDMWFRTTLGFRRTGDHWLITHEHSSSPFDPESGKASLGLKP